MAYKISENDVFPHIKRYHLYTAVSFKSDALKTSYCDFCFDLLPFITSGKILILKFSLRVTSNVHQNRMIAFKYQFIASISTDVYFCSFGELSGKDCTAFLKKDRKKHKQQTFVEKSQICGDTLTC